jgi:hypothetical protein
MRTLLLAIVLLLLPSVALAEDDERPAPPTGTPWLVAGGVATGAGVVNLIGAPLCYATLPDAHHVPCAATSVVFGLLGVGVGIPLLVVGAQKRATWIEHVSVEPRRDGASLRLGGTW